LDPLREKEWLSARARASLTFRLSFRFVARFVAGTFRNKRAIGFFCDVCQTFHGVDVQMQALRWAWTASPIGPVHSRCARAPARAQKRTGGRELMHFFWFCI